MFDCWRFSSLYLVRAARGRMLVGESKHRPECCPSAFLHRCCRWPRVSVLGSTPPRPRLGSATCRASRRGSTASNSSRRTSQAERERVFPFPSFLFYLFPGTNNLFLVCTGLLRVSHTRDFLVFWLRLEVLENALVLLSFWGGGWGVAFSLDTRALVVDF